MGGSACASSVGIEGPPDEPIERVVGVVDLFDDRTASGVALLDRRQPVAMVPRVLSDFACCRLGARGAVAIVIVRAV
jgi:hypothetical protein